MVGAPAGAPPQALDLDRLGSAIDDLDRQMQEQGATSLTGEQLVIRSAAGVTATLSVGYVLWLMQAGSLVAGLMSTMPLWRGFDPLPVLSSSGPADGDEQEVRDIFDARPAGVGR